jgi:hypothetical protein
VFTIPIWAFTMPISVFTMTDLRVHVAPIRVFTFSRYGCSQSTDTRSRRRDGLGRMILDPQKMRSAGG